MEAPTAPPVTLLGRLRATPATKRRGFGLAEISIPEEPAEGDATPFRVRNTFIDPVVKRTPSLEDFFCERAVQTCPGSQVGRLEGLFQEEGPLPPTPTRLASTPAAAPPSPAGGADPWGRSAGFGASPTADVQAGAERPGRAGPAEPLWPTALLPDAAAGPRAAPELQPEIVWPAAAGLGGAVIAYESE
ncbi:unnamed protein product [Prorocentrum cordatum]|uniref:Uncharacterized protein n=1 Tax=Prorocentrum cordatum TaxID=2364126 RepID=A0ABN9VNG6_9DINO|nr:unnamed protein product [Polarella glacialis]